jgi:hypothetical protein
MAIWIRRAADDFAAIRDILHESEVMINTGRSAATVRGYAARRTPGDLV